MLAANITDILSQFNPVDLALQILDNSSAGKDMGSFRRTKQMLSQALKGSVDSMWQCHIV
jgi:exocyst complex component 4